MHALKPVVVEYCSVCGLPHEFCEYNTEVPHPGAATRGAPDVSSKLAELTVAETAARPQAEGAAAGGDGGATAGEAQAEGAADGEAEVSKKKSSKKSKSRQVVIERATRNKRKCITSVLGLDLFGIKLADAAKKFGKKFACGASVIKDQGSNKEQIDVQGDCMDEMAEFICKEWKDVTLDDIKCVDKDKK